MGKNKKRGHPDVEEILARPWCYYCERDFDDLKILISHQKAKHFKCERCGRRLNTAGGLSVHLNQVHKETLTTVENALPNRNGLEVEIFGMEGIPEDVVASHNQRVLGQFHQAEAERRAATGNPAPGSSGGPKKPKFESPSDLKKRLAEHKAKKVAEQSTGISSGDATPVGAGPRGQSPGLGHSPGGFVSQVAPPHLHIILTNMDQRAGSPPYPQQHQQQQQTPYGAPPTAHGSYPPPYGQPGAAFQQPHFQQQQQGFGSPGMQPYPHGPPQLPPTQQYSSPGGQPFPSQFQPAPPRPFGASSPPTPFQQHHQQPGRIHTPPQHSSLPQRPGSLPPAPGLPQRPSFGAPPVNAFQMQQMHHGQVPGPPNPSAPFQGPITHGQQPSGSWIGAQNGQMSSNSSGGPPNQGTSLAGGRSAHEITDADFEDLVSQTIRNAENATNPAPEVLTEKVVETPTERKPRKEKEKDKATKLIYSDNDVSPEEKMANMPRYAFVPDGKRETVLGDAATATVTGVVEDAPDVMDTMA
ncbi:MAG: hypothetical protein M1835_008140 [Candelina submexicana]|nr:MAG: hypothetical protein M1835_008140 [Candelina submexicana]